MLANVRDIAIILLAVESLVIGIILCILLVQIRNLVVLLRTEIKPVLESTQDTAQTLKATTKFVSQRVTQPAIDVAAFAAGVRQSAKTLKRKVSPDRNNSE